MFNYYGAPDARRVIIGMGSVGETAKEVVDYLCAKGEKVGYLSVHLYRPFSAKHFLSALPETVERIAVLDRCKEPGSVGEALFVDVCAAFANQKNSPEIYGGRYGLSSKDVTPAQVKAVFDNLNQEKPKSPFTVGIEDDVTFLSLDSNELLETSSPDTFSCKFWGLGSDGTVGANKNSAKIVGDWTDQYTQDILNTYKEILCITKAICVLAIIRSVPRTWWIPQILWPVIMKVMLGNMIWSSS